MKTPAMKLIMLIIIVAAVVASVAWIAIAQASATNQVSSCFAHAMRAGVHTLARNGGFIYGHGDALYAERATVAFHYRNRARVAPSQQFMESELRRYAGAALKTCIDSVAGMDLMDLAYAPSQATVSLGAETVSITASVTGGAVPQALRSASATINAPFGRIMGIADSVAKGIATTYLLDFSSIARPDADIDIMPYGETTFVIAVQDAAADDWPPLVARVAIDLG